MKTNLNWLTLKYNDKELENSFKQNYTQSHLLHNRIAFIISFSVYAAFGILDYILTPEGIPKDVWFIRLVINVPIGICLFSLTFTQRFRNHSSLLLTTIFLISAFSIAIMPAYLPEPANLVYPFGVGLVFTALTNYLRVRYIEALFCISTSLTILFYLLFFYFDYPLSFSFSREFLGFLIDGKVALSIATFTIIFSTGVFSVVGLYGYEKGERKRFLLHQALKKQVTIDSLTQLKNRQFLDSTLVEEFKRGKRDKVPLSIIMIDIDHFKRFNDYYGHLAGDEALKTVAKTLDHSLQRPSNFVARYGGEEFCAVLPNTDKHGASSLAKILLNNIQKLTIPHDHSPTNAYLTISLGIFTIQQYADLKSVDDAVNAADIALYQAKKSGRNCYIVSSGLSDAQLQRHSEKLDIDRSGLPQDEAN